MRMARPVTSRPGALVPFAPMSKTATPTSKPVGTIDAQTDRTTVAGIVTEDQRFISEWPVYSEVARLSEDTIHRLA